VKKILYSFILLFLVLIPIKISAKEGITNYYIDATILSNGDINIKEMFIMNGKFNGMNRIINHRGSTNIFNGSIDSCKGSNIYNGDNIVINEVKGIPYSKHLEFNDINKQGDKFNEVNYANRGDYGVYTKDNKYDGIELLIYNPSSSKKAFYIDYTITNMAIVHNDIAELGFNIFTQLKEYVDNLEMIIHIPNNNNLLRIWAHGPLWGESEIIDKSTVKVIIKELEAYTPIDVRIAFDKEVLTESSKYSNTDALDKIIEIETEKANLANEEREQAIETIKQEKRIQTIFDIIKLIWVIVLIIIVYYVYNKYDKEYENEFKAKYFRDFPSNKEPTDVGYLIRKSINNDDLSASILMLIYKKVLTFEVINNKKDYNLIYHTTNDLNISDKKLIEFLYIKKFEEINDLEIISLTKLKSQANKKYEKFLKKYTNWKDEVTSKAKSYSFFENNNIVKVLSIIYSFLGIFIGLSNFLYLSIITINTKYSFIFTILEFIISIVSLIYFATFTKRTKEANFEYIKWIALKKFMEDFGTMDKKDLPDIVLWEKYLVYAVTLGCANKLAKVMKIRAEELNNFNTSNIIFDYYSFNNLMTFSTIINRTVNTSINSAYNTQSIANSRNSSGGGFGGGFSSGGGSFGGGGGGGRF